MLFQNIAIAVETFAFATVVERLKRRWRSRPRADAQAKYRSWSKNRSGSQALSRVRKYRVSAFLVLHGLFPSPPSPSRSRRARPGMRRGPRYYVQEDASPHVGRGNHGLERDHDGVKVARRSLPFLRLATLAPRVLLVFAAAAQRSATLLMRALPCGRSGRIAFSTAALTGLRPPRRCTKAASQ